MSTDQVLPALWRNVAGLLLLSLASDAASQTLRISVARLVTPGMSIESANFELNAARATALLGARGKLDATADTAAVKANCTLVHAASGWRCEGEAVLDGPRPLQATLLLQADAEQYLLQLARTDTVLRLTTPNANPLAGVTATLTAMPLDWLQPNLASRWPEAKLGHGSLDAEAHYGAAHSGALSLRYTLRNVGLDTRDGRVALAGLAANGDIGVDWRQDLRVHHVGALRGGELLWGGFYAKLPATPVALDFDVTRSSAASWQLEGLRYEDHGTLLLELAAQIDAAAPSLLSALELRHVDASFPAAYERYAKALSSTRGFGDLALRGGLFANAKWEGDALVAFRVEPKELGVSDGAGRFAIEGVDGSLAWERERELPATTLSWRSAQVYRLALGGAQTLWRSRGGELALVAPAAVPFAAGTLEIPHMVLRPDAAKGERLRAGFAAHDVDLGSVSAAFGWPKFAGRLGGAVPAIRYVGEHIELEGGLFLQLFDGSVNLTNLALERPFGVAPSLAADIALEKLDLQPLTAAFGFGEITGRLSGRIDALRTIDWAPVAFDAELHTEGPGKLSQRAVNNLTSVGGGGLAAGLQASVLRIFDTFGYNRIGLRCKLHNNVCAMGGIDSSGAGYTIVEGRGLPHVTVVGHQGNVDWPTLVARLKAATSGTAPIIH